MNADYILIYPGGETPVLISEGFLDQGKKLVIVSPEIRKEKKNSLHYIKWNITSAISAKNAVLSLSNSMDAIPPIIVIFPEISNQTEYSHQTQYAEIESTIDMSFKAMVFVLKELTAAAKRNLPQNIILCLPKRPETRNAIIQSCYDSALNLGDNLFKEYGGSGCRFYGFQNAYDDVNRFSDYLIHQIPLLTKKSEGKWNIAGEKSSFFSNRKK